jgi:hypothetical protein
MLYIDNARLWVDAMEDPEAGAIGSNWQVGFTKEEAEQAVEDLVSQGWTRAHWTNPRF